MSETSTSTQATGRFPRRRGVGFPVVSLREAVAILQKAGQHGHEYPASAFARYLGHSTTNSGSFKRRLASFRDFGLIAGGTGNQVVLTDLGRRVAHPTDPTMEKQNLWQAFENCDVFVKIWENAAKGEPYGQVTLANLGVQLGVAPASKNRFAESLSQSAVAAGFAEMDGDRVRFVLPGAGKVRVPQAPMPNESMGPFGIVSAPGGRRPAPPAVFPGSRMQPSGIVSAPPPDEEDEGPMPIDSSEAHLDAFGATVWSSRADMGAGSAVGGRPREMTLDEEEEYGPSSIHTPAYPIASEADTAVAKRTSSPERPALLHRQSWEIGGGSLTLEIRSVRSLPAEAFMQIGRVMTEVEKLKALLANGAEAGSGESR